MLVGCSDKNASGKNKDVTVHLYTSESQDQVGEMMKEFEKENPGIKVEIFRTGTEQVIAKMEAERQSGGLVADMVWFADIDYFNSLSEEDLLEEYKSPNAEGLDESFIYNNGKYYEVRQIFNVLAYNTTQVKNAPTSWNDLYSTDYKGKAAMASPNYSGAAFLTLASIVHNDDLGWDYFKSLKENDLKFEQGNGALASKVASGEYHVVSVVDFMARNAKNEGSPVEVVWPEEGAVIIPTPVGIMKDSEVKDAAKKVLDFLLSKQGQEMFKDQGYIPVNPEVGVPENAPDTDEINIMPLDFDFLKENRESLKTGFSDIFGEQ
ncbi:ABC transporter substrate-binding protein [Ornithinibacillus bavariensis]|uniref:ABC transporter substrate-binding protein n=2 Tax=Ornithinibacillus bavariensis TaxID=545502 RepID=A0A919XAB8_9BACI|nr:ABC transporter substrate-binding protein [Ornithinibacillus bavariensis]